MKEDEEASVRKSLFNRFGSKLKSKVHFSVFLYTIGILVFLVVVLAPFKNKIFQKLSLASPSFAQTSSADQTELLTTQLLNANDLYFQTVSASSSSQIALPISSSSSTTQSSSISTSPTSASDQLTSLKQIATQRKNLLLQEIRSDPQLFLKHARLAGNRNSFPKEVQDQIEEEKTISGSFVNLHSDIFKYGMSTNRFFLATSDKKQYNLIFTDSYPSAVNGRDQVTAHGIVLDQNIVMQTATLQGSNKVLGAQSVLGSAPTQYSLTVNAPSSPAVTTGTIKTIVLLVSYLGSSNQPFTQDYMKNEFFSSTNAISVTNYFSENSYNQLTLSGDVSNWLYIPAPTINPPDKYGWTCDMQSVVNNANSAAAGQQSIDLSQYQLIIYVFDPAHTCQPPNVGGSSTINGTYSFIFDAWPSVFEHEIGHTLGLNHSNWLTCNNGPVSDYSHCVTYEYYDTSDAMSFARHDPFTLLTGFQYNAPHKEALGWLTPNNELITYNAGSYTIPIYPLENPVSNNQIQVVKIPKTDTGDFYYVSYRQPLGVDSYGLNPNYTDGVCVHIWNVTPLTLSNPKFTEQTQLVDAKIHFPIPGIFDLPSGDPCLTDTQVLTDSINGVVITQLSHNVQYATVNVTKTTNFSPTITLIPTIPAFDFNSQTGQDYVGLPNGTLQAGPGTINLGQNLTITTQGIPVPGFLLNKVEVWETPVNTNAPVLIQQFTVNSDQPVTLGTNWTPQSPGLYSLFVQVYNANPGTKCSGNPFGPPVGFGSCGAQGWQVITVNGSGPTQGPTPTPGNITLSGTINSYDINRNSPQPVSDHAVYLDLDPYCGDYIWSLPSAVPNSSGSYSLTGLNSGEKFCLIAFPFQGFSGSSDLYGPVLNKGSFTFMENNSTGYGGVWDCQIAGGGFSPDGCGNVYNPAQFGPNLDFDQTSDSLYNFTYYRPDLNNVSAYIASPQKEYGFVPNEAITVNAFANDPKKQLTQLQIFGEFSGTAPQLLKTCTPPFDITSAHFGACSLNFTLPGQNLSTQSPYLYNVFVQATSASGQTCSSNPGGSSYISCGQIANIQFPPLLQNYFTGDAALVPAIVNPASHTISGTVFLDSNSNGVQDSSEPGTSGISVTLSGNSLQQPLIASTNSGGSFSFATLLPGSYTVTASLPPGYSGTTANPVSVSIPSGSTPAVTLSFGYNTTPNPTPAPVTISGVVFLDNNGDGSQDNGEGGVGGLTVTARQIVGSNQFTINKAITASDGSYSMAVPYGSANNVWLSARGYSFTTPVSISLDTTQNQTANFGIVLPTTNVLKGTGMEHPTISSSYVQNVQAFTPSVLTQYNIQGTSQFSPLIPAGYPLVADIQVDVFDSSGTYVTTHPVILAETYVNGGTLSGNETFTVKGGNTFYVVERSINSNATYSNVSMTTGGNHINLLNSSMQSANVVSTYTQKYDWLPSSSSCETNPVSFTLSGTSTFIPIIATSGYPVVADIEADVWDCNNNYIATYRPVAANNNVNGGTVSGSSTFTVRKGQKVAIILRSINSTVDFSNVVLNVN